MGTVGSIIWIVLPGARSSGESIGPAGCRSVQDPSDVSEMATPMRMYLFREKWLEKLERACKASHPCQKQFVKHLLMILWPT